MVAVCHKECVLCILYVKDNKNTLLFCKNTTTKNKKNSGIALICPMLDYRKGAYLHDSNLFRLEVELLNLMNLLRWWWVVQGSRFLPDMRAGAERSGRGRSVCMWVCLAHILHSPHLLTIQPRLAPTEPPLTILCDGEVMWLSHDH